jgi:hypothetical protein
MRARSSCPVDKRAPRTPRARVRHSNWYRQPPLERLNLNLHQICTSAGRPDPGTHAYGLLQVLYKTRREACVFFVFDPYIHTSVIAAVHVRLARLLVMPSRMLVPSGCSTALAVHVAHDVAGVVHSCRKKQVRHILCCTAPVLISENHVPGCLVLLPL